ncbi:MAG: medium chain dehydrogenase/reductase family protein [Acidobacteria bacterium]|nr:medium chain dehydrogenase/reductase family protein [Acidobacteriota bacterium]
MREVVITHHGGPDVLEERQRLTPDPASGEVRIRVKACGVNFADVLARMDLFPDAPKPPMVPGYEVSGYVDAIGPGPTRHEMGRHVVALTRFGGYADCVIVPAEFVWGVPQNLSHNEAASIPVNYLTASVALYRMAGLKSGEWVLIHGAGGGVGIAAIQLSRLRRATVVGTASAAKHNALRSLGIDHVIDYRTADVEAEVARITNGRGVDVVLDPLGGENLIKSYRMLAPLGRLVSYGAQDMVGGQHRIVVRSLHTLWQMPRFNPVDLMNDNKGVFGLNLGHLWEERRFLSGAMEALLTDFAGGRLKAVVSKTFPLGRAADAHRFLQDRANVGKVVLTV